MLMIVKIENVPENMVGFQLLGEVTRDDFEEKIIPEVKALAERTGKLNYLMVIDTALQNFTPGAWLQDALLSIKNFSIWNRVAILSDAEPLKTFTSIFSIVVPGEFRGFSKDQLEAAVAWVSEQK